MNVGILTFHASHNYGSMLQAYALQTTLTKLGVDSRIINFRSNVQKSLIPPPIEWSHPRLSLFKLLREPSKTIALSRKYRRFEQFLRRDLNITEELSTEAEVAEHISRNNYDAIITGSDQIWNPACWDFSTVYLCDFPFVGKKIAYAPSLGSHPEEIPDKDIAPIIELAAGYDSLSTREKRGRDFLSSKIDKQISIVLDPTFLLKAEDYELITSDKTIDQPYILYYTPREEKGYFKSALSLAEILNLKIVVTQAFNEYDGYDNIIYQLDCGPKEFLSLVKNATYCIGNSFHLLAFSLILKKEFIIISHEQDSRILNILEQMGLDNRLQCPNNNIQVHNKIEYNSVASKMGILASDSINFLATVFNVLKNGIRKA